MEPKVEDQQVYQGRLGRTSKTSVLISSEAGPVFPASIYTGLNATEDPELREALFAGELNVVECPFTEGKTYALAIPVRYHDEARRLFVLIVPEALRHEEFKHRSELLQELAKEREILPEYVRDFRTVFSVNELGALERAADAAPERDPEVAPEDDEAPAAAAASTSGLKPPPAAKADAGLEEARAEIEQTREELALQRQQLDDVSERLERERERMEEVEMNIATDRAELERQLAAFQQERAELERERQQLEAMRLNIEQRERELADGVLTAGPDEKTQVVTDDQFIEVVEEEVQDPDLLLDEDEILHSETPLTSLHSETSLPEDVDDDDFGPDDATHITHVPSLHNVHVPSTFDQSASGGQDYYTRLIDGAVVAAWRTTKKSVDRVLDNDPQLFIQFAIIEGYPVASILLASLDEDQRLENFFGWPLDVTHDTDRAIIDALMIDSAVRFAFYDRKNNLLRTYDAKLPLEANVRWIKQRAEEHLERAEAGSGTFGKAAMAFFSKDYEHLGTMRHNFSRDSFTDLKLPSEIKLAAGIVGYWSGGEVFDYLIGNRSFPIEDFRAIQRRVVDAALRVGVYLNQPLRQIALDDHLVDHERALARRLMANFAELSVGLRENDLDPIEQWENWDALLSFADDVGVQPDADVVELAQAALRRAQEFQFVEQEEPGEATVITSVDAVKDRKEAEEAEKEKENKKEEGGLKPPPSMPKAPALSASTSVDDLVVARRSETTGVTYFLPDEDVLDQFDDLASMSKEDLMLLLEDSAGRLEACQMLIERFGAPVVSDVLATSENMHASEVAALAKFLESRAGGLEGELVRCVESGGPSTTYIAAHALTQIRSTSAIPVLIEALRDPERAGNRQALATTLSGYGDKLLASLKRVIKRHGAEDAILDLLVALERREEGALAKLAKDRHRKVREAAKQARKSL